MTVKTASSPPDPPSPCVGVCVIHSKTQWCEGCCRTLEEISGWWDYGPEQKRAILNQLDDRLNHLMDGAFD